MKVRRKEEDEGMGRSGEAESGPAISSIVGEGGKPWLAGQLAPSQSWVQGQINESHQDMIMFKEVDVHPGTK